MLRKDFLHPLDESAKELIWTSRATLNKNPNIFLWLLQTIDFLDPRKRAELPHLLSMWTDIPAHSAISVLSFRYQDYYLRSFAVNCLRKLSDSELQLYLLQLTQSLKSEPYHRSPLSEFLLERAIRSPLQIGHFFFWHLKSDLSNPFYCERYALLLEDYLTNCPISAGKLRKQNNCMVALQKIAENVCLRSQTGLSRINQRMFANDLKKLNRQLKKMPDSKFQLPLHPSIEVAELIVRKCRFMSSKMAPLWLIFENATHPEAPNTYIIFKSGDDLRQDILTLQILQIMDQMWLRSGLDMRLTPYRVISTGVTSQNKGVGMIEVVLNADTTSGIQLKYGGGAGGAFQEKTISDFLTEYSNVPGHTYHQAVENFMRSCAGYVVATSVLGIGDRHNGNIMVTKDGHLFHIDFGHFLGNFKSKFGVKRERVAFVFTPDMAYVLDSTQNYQNFLMLVKDAFKILRENKNLSCIGELFMQMSSAGMPELQDKEDLRYIINRLRINKDENAACDWMVKEVKKSRDSKWRQVDNWFHNKKTWR